MGTAEGEEREKEAERLLKEIIAEKFPILGDNYTAHEAKRIPNYINTIRPCPRHIIQKLSKVNDNHITQSNLQI